MPQQTLFGGWNIVAINLGIELPVNKPGGRVSMSLWDENRRHAGGRTVQWNKPRDLNDLPLVANDVVAAFMWAPQLEIVETLRTSFARHCPELTQAQQID